MGTLFHASDWYSAKSQHPFSSIISALGCSTPPPPIAASLEALFWDQTQSWSFKTGGIGTGGMLKEVLLASFSCGPPSSFTVTSTCTHICLMHGLLLPSAGCTPQCKAPSLQNHIQSQSQLGLNGRGAFTSATLEESLV